MPCCPSSLSPRPAAAATSEAASSATELVPAGAVLYGEATLEPEGDQKEAIDAILSKFPGGGQAGDKLKDLIEKGLRESDAPVSFKEDIEPWLGDEAAFFVSNLSPTGEDADAAGLIATDDEDQAQAALEKSAEGKKTKKTYKDVEYLTDESGEAGAVFDGFLVLGTERGVKAAIDTSKGGQNLSDDEDYDKALDGASDDRLGLFYVNSQQVLKAMPQGAALPESFEQYFKEPFIGTFDADEDGVLFEATIPEQLAKTFAFFGQGSDLLTDMPVGLLARAWRRPTSGSCSTSTSTRSRAWPAAATRSSSSSRPRPASTSRRT